MATQNNAINDRTLDDDPDYLIATARSAWPAASVTWEYPWFCPGKVRQPLRVTFNDGVTLIIGDANETWSAELYHSDEEIEEGYWSARIITDISTDTAVDAVAIIAAIRVAFADMNR